MTFLEQQDFPRFQPRVLARLMKSILVGGILSTTPLVSLALASDVTTAETESLEVISVKGSYSRSLERAVDLKKSNTGFSDSIVATDVADFPEQNLAEALQRMPGVTIERNKGLGSKVNVRSLPTEFTHVSINNLATASGSGGRDVEFDIFASEIIQSVTVQKSPSAADEEGGIAGSVQISTARPFDYSDSKFILSAEGAHNSISKEIDPKLSLLASDTFGDWGALVSFSTSQRTNRTDSNSGINFRPMGRFLEASGARSAQAITVLERDAGVTVNDRLDKNETNRIIFQDKVGDRVYLNDQDKWGATASLQYKPSNTFSLTFDAMLGGYKAVEDEYDAAAYTASSRSTLETIHDYDDTTLAEYGIVVLTDVSYTATQHEFLSKERINDTDFTQYSLALDWQLQGWDINALVGYSGADKTLDYANLKHVAYASSRSRWTANGGETLASAGFDMYSSPESYLFEAYETELENVTDDKYAAQLDFKKALELGFLPALSSVQFGVRYTDKSKERQFGATKIQGPTAGSSEWVNTRTMADSQLQLVTDIVPGGNYQPKDLNWMQISNDYARNTFRYSGFSVPFNAKDYYRVDEEVLSLYAMANMDFDLAGKPVFLNAGVRAVDTSVLSFGYHQIQNADGSTGFTTEPISKEGSYNELLPSLNMTMEVLDDVLVRAAASETLMRPALTNIAYKRSVSWNSFRFTDGNPDLKPTYAKQWELGVEWYLENGGLLAASYFWKDIEGVVRQELTGTVPNVEKLNANGSLDGYYEFDVYQPVNAEGSYKVTGLELIAQLPLSRLHPVLDGFGINANYTILDNTLTGSSDLDIPTPPEGLADTTWNFTFYYENESFDARISYNYKDKYVEVIERSLYPVYRDAYGQTDIALGYKLNDNIKLSLKAINVTDEATKGYTLTPAFPVINEYSGRRISLGLRADF
ncbi:TonB-dependent receptor [Alishewanella sp. 16-MA]|uniref:TonB-dependent receptor n=1 Tax=Alishewanella maricola TaxID=2795740 RepID=A0ABS8C7K8_9ALTE|nr:TonB-dependent receptor [Alishewanella maricola]MCB5228333.1 TonB-dependent receptor [Alishewanella maricola]